MSKLAKYGFLGFVVLPIVAVAQTSEVDTAKKEMKPPRQETISCGLVFNNAKDPEAVASQLVQDGVALIRAEANGFEYVMSVRGKTSVAILKEVSSGNVIKAQGAIELLRGGGRVDEPKRLALRKGQDDGKDDDDRNGEVEREAGFELSIKESTAAGGRIVVLKCASFNEVVK